VPEIRQHFRSLREAPNVCYRLFRFESLARQTVGLGDVARLDDTPAVAAAVDRASAADVVSRLTSGLDTQLDPTWPGGVDVSFGQWQKLALARGYMLRLAYRGSAVSPARRPVRSVLSRARLTSSPCRLGRGGTRS
jgi:hypothetical protein